MTAPIADFALAARRFCVLVESTAPDVSDLAAAMAALYGAALALPDLPGEDGAPHPRDPAPLDQLRLPFDVYWDVFDPFRTPPDEPVANSLYDDVADIRQDLRRGLDLFDRGFPAAACAEWRVLFHAHWGEHLVGAQRALFLAHPPTDEGPESSAERIAE